MTASPTNPTIEQDAADALPSPTWSGTLKVFGVELKCHVLQDGQRIIEADSICRLFDAMGEEGPIDLIGLDQFVRWQRGGAVPDAEVTG